MDMINYNKTYCLHNGHLLLMIKRAGLHAYRNLFAGLVMALIVHWQFLPVRWNARSFE
jgi:hypothetical protein